MAVNIISQVSDTSETQGNNHFLHPGLGFNVSLNGIQELLADLTDFNNLTSIPRIHSSLDSEFPDGYPFDYQKQGTLHNSYHISSIHGITVHM